MTVKIISSSPDKLTLQVEFSFNTALLESEESILSILNEAGSLATLSALKRLDTQGEPLLRGEVKLTSKGQLPKTYHTPYGDVTLNRYVYQSRFGGKTYCPLEEEGRIILNTTPRFSKMISYKYAQMGGIKVQEDLLENHGRKTVLASLQKVSELVGSIAQAQEEEWEYTPPPLTKPIKSIGLGLDGTCMFLAGEGYRQAMVGTIAFYDKEGERQHTIYLGATPEYGKETFLERLTREIERSQKLYPRANYVGVADGAKDNWSFLEEHSEKQILDFYHATEYLNEIAWIEHPTNQTTREEWMEEKCHQLKHEEGSAEKLLEEMNLLKERRLKKSEREELEKTITYFTNNKHRMNYAEHVKEKLPIGSGVTEAACKTLIKHRLCASGMQWKEKGASSVISLRALVLTTGRWSQFWSKISQVGFSLAS